MSLPCLGTPLLHGNKMDRLARIWEECQGQDSEELEGLPIKKLFITLRVLPDAICICGFEVPV